MATIEIWVQELPKCTLITTPATGCIKETLNNSSCRKNSRIFALDTAFMAAVLGDVARARNLSALARETGIARETF